MKHFKFKQAVRFDVKSGRHFFKLGVHAVSPEVEETDLFKMLVKRELVVPMNQPAKPKKVEPKKEEPKVEESAPSESSDEGPQESSGMSDEELEEATKPENEKQSKKSKKGK